MGGCSFRTVVTCFMKNNGWRTWDRSQTYCKEKSAISGLVVINSIEEQEFIHANIKHYYDDYHGYWIGLSKQNGKWVWDDGREDTLGFWMKKEFGDTGPKALMIPNQNVTESWDPAKNEMNNRFICESKALIIN
ncbi:hypothetical protein NL108_016468 [Boleophthalmus pectinirostris]|nr:hypothetical protein NL108_016468 [Boleophthalmus pectinirostris]